MLQAAIKRDGIKIRTVFLPEHPKELMYGMYLDYTFFQDEIADWVTSQIKLKKDFDYQYTTKIATCVGQVFSIPPDEIRNMKYKDLPALEMLWGHLETLITSFRPSDNAGKFRVGHTWYEIPEINKAYFKGTNNLPEMTVQQMEKIGEAEDKLQTAISIIDEELKKEKVKGTIKSRAMQRSQETFNNTLKKIALCVNEPKNIPTDSSFDMWIEKEAKNMTKISMEDALNTLFFLGGMPKDYGLLIGLSSISHHLKLDRSRMKRRRHTVKGRTTSQARRN